MLLGSIPALAITVLVATSPVALSLVNNPNSHAVTLLLVIWGMYLAVRWWLMGGIGTALLSGLLVGSAVSIRYTEGMLLLPLAFVVLFRLTQTRWSIQTWREGLLLLAGWAIPVIALFWHNRVAMGTWTGYDPTNESTGFGWRYFVENWDTMLRLMYQTGMTLIFPMAVGGLAAGFVWNWRVATFLASWIVPCVLLYSAYYWAPEGLNIGLHPLLPHHLPGAGHLRLRTALLAGLASAELRAGHPPTPQDGRHLRSHPRHAHLHPAGHRQRAAVD